MAGAQTNSLERVNTLAESGRYSDALEQLKVHIRTWPDDAQAWNDAGTVLYCMGRIREALEHFERAKLLANDSQLGQICWNLCEAYLDGGFAEKAAGLFDLMERFGILNTDTLNRTANAFLQNESLGKAMQMLSLSLKMNPQQEILLPMAEVIRAKRAKVVIFAPAQSDSTDELFEFLRTRCPAELHRDSSPEQICNALQWCDIAWFEGAEQLAGVMDSLNGGFRVVVRLSAKDIYHGQLENIDWGRVDVVLVNAGACAERALIEKLPGIESKTRFVRIPVGADADKFEFAIKNRGKNIAYISDFSADSNAPFLLHCMQKLHYIDNSYKLYIAGAFCNKSIENYIRHIIEVFGLAGVVNFDGRVNNFSGWLADKHFIVSTAINEMYFTDVLKAMACGLKPVVHNFPGASEMLDGDLLFNLSEDFCRQLTSGDYQPNRYRNIACRRCSSQQEAIDNIIIELEQNMAVPGEQVREVIPPARRAQPPQYENHPQPQHEAIVEQHHKVMVQQPQPSPSDLESPPPSVRQPAKIIRIKPLGADMQQQRQPTPDVRAVQEKSRDNKIPDTYSRQTGAPERTGAIDDLAAQALNAARALRELADRAAPKRYKHGNTRAADNHPYQQQGNEWTGRRSELDYTCKTAEEFAEKIIPINSQVG